MATQVYGDGINSTGGANNITLYYNRAGIKAANAVNIYQQFADKQSMPKKNGKTFKISKWLHIYDRKTGDADFATKGYLTARTLEDVTASIAASALNEGATGGNEVNIEKITFDTQFTRVGNMLPYTDEVELFSEDAIQVRCREELGALANLKSEDMIQVDMLATPTVLRAGSATNMAGIGATQADGSDDAVWRISYDLIRKADRLLTRNRAKKRTSIVVGSNKIGTAPVAKAHYAIIGADVKADMENLTRGTGNETEFVFQPVHRYASAGNQAEGEVGFMHSVRFIESETALTYAGKGAVPPQNYVGDLAITGATDLTSANPADRGNFDVHPILFPSEGAFATVGLKGMDNSGRGKIQFHSRSPSDIDSNNTYGTKGFFSYNFFYAGIILEPEKLLKVLVAVSK